VPDTAFFPSFAGSAQIVNLEEFQMSHWAEFQMMLKSHYFVIHNGNVIFGIIMTILKRLIRKRRLWKKLTS